MRIAGASGNLGAEALRAAAKALEHAGREGSQDLGHLLADVEASAAVVFRSVDTLREPAAAVAAGAARLPVPAAARGALNRLQTALGDFDVSAAGSALAELESVAVQGAIGEVAQLRKHVDSYEYDEARALATQLLARIGTGVQ